MTLNRRRQGLDLSYRDVANATGLSLRSVFRLMADNTLPQSLCARQTLAVALKVDLAELSALVAGKSAKRGALRTVVDVRGGRRAHAQKIQGARS